MPRIPGLSFAMFSDASISQPVLRWTAIIHLAGWICSGSGLDDRPPVVSYPVRFLLMFVVHPILQNLRLTRDPGNRSGNRRKG